ncbi:MAG: DUF2807 domain-containing protein [Dysgonamonadaceae bacterium]|jgi:phage shock protein PspC (stress-responsive transcriptional regulator)|nr:DUF2807 domain-containing protein [Dysgonamonadaceae bacterium]
MKKTLTVNLNGRVFNIDEDAYQLLDKYLRNLRIYFRKEDGSDEILADFEARIEELLSDRVRLGYSVITIAEVEQVIARMGRPGDFGENEEDVREEKSAGCREDEFAQVKKKFYRNPDDKMFAGLCSGVAAYFGWNIVAVRIIVGILVPATSFWIVPVYLIGWLVIPEAVTAEQQLEMQGKPITVENIGKTVAAGMEERQRKASKSGCLASLVDFIVAFFKVCLVGLGLIIGILIIIIIVLFCVLFGLGTGILGGLIPWTDETFLFVEHPTLATSAFCLIIGIPLIALVYTVISHLFKLKPVHPGVKWAGIILWIAAVVALPFSGFKADWKKLSDNRLKGWHCVIDDDCSTLRGNGITADRKETFPPVQYIRLEKHLAGNLQIEQTEGDSASLIINGDSNLIDKVEIKIKDDNTLSLSTVDYFRFRPTNTLLIRLQTPNPKGVKVFSVGNVNISGAVRSADFSIYMEGAGKIQADSLYADVLNVRNEGVGSVYLGGVARTAALKLKGVGHIQAMDLISDSVYAEVNGVGSVKCHPVEYLQGYVNGIGTISYKSEPKSKNTSINGLGKIKSE